VLLTHHKDGRITQCWELFLCAKANNESKAAFLLIKISQHFRHKRHFKSMAVGVERRCGCMGIHQEVINLKSSSSCGFLQRSMDIPFAFGKSINFHWSHQSLLKLESLLWATNIINIIIIIEVYWIWSIDDDEQTNRRARQAEWKKFNQKLNGNWYLSKWCMAQVTTKATLLLMSSSNCY